MKKTLDNSTGMFKLTGIHFFSTQNQFWPARTIRDLSWHVNQWNLQEIS